MTAQTQDAAYLVPPVARWLALYRPSCKSPQSQIAVPQDDLLEVGAGFAKWWELTCTEGSACQTRGKPKGQQYKTALLNSS